MLTAFKKLMKNNSKPLIAVLVGAMLILASNFALKSSNKFDDSAVKLAEDNKELIIDKLDELLQDKLDGSDEPVDEGVDGNG